MTTSDKELREDAQAQVMTWIDHDRDCGFIPDGDSARAYSIRMDDNIFEKRIRRLSLEVEVLEEAMAILPADDQIRRLRCQQAIEVARHRMEFAEDGRRYLQCVSKEVVSDEVMRARTEHQLEFDDYDFEREGADADAFALRSEIQCAESTLFSSKNYVRFLEDELRRTTEPTRHSRTERLIKYQLAKVKLNEGILRHLRGL